MLYVSLHIPKTGGTTLRYVLQRRFGERLQLAYAQRHQFPCVADPQCVHGHTVFRHFTDLLAAHPEKRYFTFLRDPLESAISHYHYMVKQAARPDAREDQRFEDRGLHAWLTHEEPYRWPQPPGYRHNRYADWFEHHPIEAYDFIGTTEEFDASMLLMYRQFAWPTVLYRPVNVGAYAAPSLPAEVERRFRQLNAEDYRLYHEAVLFLARLRAGYGPHFERDLAEFRRQLQAFPGDQYDQSA